MVKSPPTLLLFKVFLDSLHKCKNLQVELLMTARLRGCLHLLVAQSAQPGGLLPLVPRAALIVKNMAHRPHLFDFPNVRENLLPLLLQFFDKALLLSIRLLGFGKDCLVPGL